MNLGCFPAFGENMLSAYELNGFAHHRCAAKIIDFVGHTPDCRIGRNPTGCIRSAAFDRNKKI